MKKLFKVTYFGNIHICIRRDL